MKKSNVKLAWKKATAMIAMASSVVGSIGYTTHNLEEKGMKEANSEIDESSFDYGYYVGLMDANIEETLSEERIDYLMIKLNEKNENSNMKEADLKLDENSYKIGYKTGYNMAILEKSKEEGKDYIGIQTNDYDISYAPIDDLTAIYSNEENTNYYVIENYDNEKIIESGRYENLLNNEIINENITDFDAINFRTYVNNVYGEGFYEDYSKQAVLSVTKNNMDKKYFEESSKIR